MALTVASSSIVQDTTGTSIVVDKPSGLTAGDLMVANIQFLDSVDRASTPAGWTRLGTDAVCTFSRSALFYKVADASDVAASTFTFSLTSSELMQIALLRITDPSVSQPIINFSVNPTVVNDTKTPSVNNTITPFTNSLLLFITSTDNDTPNVTTISNYAIATSNPAWTEIVDINTSSAGVTMSLGIAYATRPENTATGNSSFEITTGSSANDLAANAVLVSINAYKDFTISDTSSITEISKLTAIELTRTDTIVETDSLLNSKSREWTTTSKPTTIWTNKQE